MYTCIYVCIIIIIIILILMIMLILILLIIIILILILILLFIIIIIIVCTRMAPVWSDSHLVSLQVLAQVKVRELLSFPFRRAGT